MAGIAKKQPRKKFSTLAQQNAAKRTYRKKKRKESFRQLSLIYFEVNNNLEKE